VTELMIDTDATVDTEETSPLLNLFARFNLTLDSLTKQLERQNNIEQRKIARIPLTVAIERMSATGAVATDIKDFGSPFDGHKWIVRLLGTIADPLGANAATVTWYVGQNTPGSVAGQLPVTKARWQQGVPKFDTFTKGGITIGAKEHLIAGLTGIPASSFIGLIACVEDYLISESV
jgi:hypothetical protein